MEFVNVDDEVTNLASEVRAFTYRPCNYQTGSYCWVLDTGIEPVALR